MHHDLINETFVLAAIRLATKQEKMYMEIDKMEFPDSEEMDHDYEDLDDEEADTDTENNSNDLIDEPLNNVAEELHPGYAFEVQPAMSEESSDDSDPESPHKCTNCDFRTGQTANFNRHTKTIIRCSFCPEVFCGQRSNRRHESHVKKEHEYKPKKVHICEICKKPFPYPYVLKRHLNRSRCGRKASNE